MKHETNWSTTTLDRTVMTNLASKAQQLKIRQFGKELVSAPGFEMLLDLYMQADPLPRSLTALTAASSASERNALRIIHRMVKQGLLLRYRDPSDGRRKIVELTPEAIIALDSFFDHLVTFIKPAHVKPAQPSRPAQIHGQLDG